ncbi:MAG: peptidoglycan DD-metalloendopeptidase family protein [Flavobacteriales bacterium]
MTNNVLNISFLAKLVLVSLTLSACFGSDDDKPETTLNLELPEPVDTSRLFFDMHLDSFQVLEDEFKYGETLGKVLNDNGVSHQKVHYLAQASKDIFDVRDLKVGRPYKLFQPLDTAKTPEVLAYHANATDVYFYHFGDSIFVEKKSKPVDIRLEFASGIIESSLSQTMEKAGLSQRLVLALADNIYPWTINFFSVQKGDKFKVLYLAKYVEDEFIGVDRVLASNFNHFDNDFYAFSFDNEGFDDYYNDEGKNLRNFFLKAPVQYSRISSRYQKRRRHPVLGKIRAHKGTDFAAPKNTPIYSTADGIVTHARYKGGNGNYVKVKHNATYTTQYLHMNKFAKGIKPGKKVSQGQVIGYVGKTGLATGYHVCYRFWYKGKQVDPFKVNLPPSEPISDDLRPQYELVRDQYKTILDAHGWETPKLELDPLPEIDIHKKTEPDTAVSL